MRDCAREGQARDLSHIQGTRNTDMRRWGWLLTASLLLAVCASGQQAAPTAAPATVQPVSTTPGLAVAQQSTARTPASIDQVVDQIIEREHALMAFLKNR